MGKQTERDSRLVAEGYKLGAREARGKSLEFSALLCALRDLANYADRNHCTHEETHRGGVLWEICDSCGAKWADDEGGKPESAGKLPGVIELAYELLDKHDTK